MQGRRRQTQDLYWFGNNPCLHPVPKQPPVLEISNNLVQSFTSKDPQEMYLPLELIHKKYTLSCSQYYNPSRCTLYLYHKGCILKCVKKNKSYVVSPLNLCKRKQKISQAVSPLKSFVHREEEESKEISGG